ncbi:hypothetical protein PR003_g18775 [Phytophthora rubi]|uniref:Uncharacterized protein n=1 Tax=Phytophthora rubi TaxID=129364 RepID=A0A6A3KC26_9STRA|nr:hypothetical protein PR002_g17904 [Phytophthora rubi]KAE9001763.1 hypothetical protein PR001_g18435 [Phytophthora rubi]KAE9316222.1 hypothetical protein PR003_g18775 [Phytophthora rubi]
MAQPRRTLRSDREEILRKLEGRSAEDRARLARDHQAYLNGERDQDMVFEATPAAQEAAPAPAAAEAAPVAAAAAAAAGVDAASAAVKLVTGKKRTPTKPRAATKPLKGGLQRFYDSLAKTPTLKGKMPRAALYAEELAAAAASAEEDGDGDGDEDYEDDGDEDVEEVQVEKKTNKPILRPKLGETDRQDVVQATRT